MSVRFGGKLDSYQTLLFLEERMGLGLFVWNLDTDELQWSDGMFALFGLKPGSAQPTMALTLSMTHPDDRLSPGWLRQTVREGQLLDREFRIILRDGRVRNISQRAWLVDGGNQNEVAGVCVDVTRLFEARAQSDFIQQRLRELVNTANCMVWTAPVDASALQPIRLMAATPPDLPANWLERVQADDKLALKAVWSSAVANQQPFALLHRITQANGSSRWYRSHAAPLRDHEGSIIEWIGLTIDVNDLVASAQSPQITGAQIRGGRGILNWSVRDLVEATGLTIGTVRRLEGFDGTSRGDEDALSEIRRVMSQAGVEFLSLPNGKPAVRPS